MSYSDLDRKTQQDILGYEFVVDVLRDMADNEVHDVFRRINTYSEKLKPQELRNAQWFGDFKSSVYLLAKEFTEFLERNEIFTSKQVLRMAEAEFISDLLLAMEEGIREGNKAIRDKAYTEYDDRFPNRQRHERRFRETMDAIGAILGDEFPTLKFRAPRLFYPLFCAVYHMKWGLPRLKARKRQLRQSQYPKLRIAVEEIDDLIDRVQVAERAHEEIELTAASRRFYDSYNTHWVHAVNRTFLTRYICTRFVVALT